MEQQRRTWFLKSRREPKRRALVGNAIATDLAGHQIDQLFADRQAQAGASLFTRGGGVHLGEWQKQTRAGLFRNANAGIDDFKPENHMCVIL